ncbi:MAG: hypothetical protein EZS28_033113, partial [Streblomastix strix]
EEYDENDYDIVREAEPELISKLEYEDEYVDDNEEFDMAYSSSSDSDVYDRVDDYFGLEDNSKYYYDDQGRRFKMSEKENRKIRKQEKKDLLEIKNEQGKLLTRRQINKMYKLKQIKYEEVERNIPWLYPLPEVAGDIFRMNNEVEEVSIKLKGQKLSNVFGDELQQVQVSLRAIDELAKLHARGAAFSDSYKKAPTSLAKSANLQQSQILRLQQSSQQQKYNEFYPSNPRDTPFMTQNVSDFPDQPLQRLNSQQQFIMNQDAHQYLTQPFQLSNLNEKLQKQQYIQGRIRVFDPVIMDEDPFQSGTFRGWPYGRSELSYLWSANSIHGNNASNIDFNTMLMIDTNANVGVNGGQQQQVQGGGQLSSRLQEQSVIIPPPQNSSRSTRPLEQKSFRDQSINNKSQLTQQQVNQQQYQQQQQQQVAMNYNQGFHRESKGMICGWVSGSGSMWVKGDYVLDITSQGADKARFWAFAWTNARPLTLFDLRY